MSEKSKLEKFTDVFMKCEKKPSVVDTVADFDPLRQKTIKAGLERLKKEKHPVQYHYRAQRELQQIQQQLGYFVGTDKYAGRFDDLGDEEQIKMYTSMGTDAMDDLINPEGR